MLSRLERIIKDAGLAEKRFLLAISGGIDSMVLAHLFARLGLEFSVAHCNFQLREDAMGDQEFVKGWCLENNINCYTKQFDTRQYIAENKAGVQEAARDLRYQYFNELLHKNSYDLVVTAHHADDNIETVLFNFLRGTSIKGMTGMLSLNNSVYRPMLFFLREEIVKYAQQEKLSWREDASNAKNDYSRNFLRNEIIPTLEEQIPNVKKRMLGTINRLKETEQIYAQEIEIRKNKLVEKTGAKSFRVPIRKLLKQQPLNSIVYELFASFGLKESQIEELIKLTKTQAGARIITGTHVLLNHRNHIVIEPKEEQEQSHFIIENTKGHFNTSQGILSWELSDNVPQEYNSDSNSVFIDATNIDFPLLVRSPRVADYFYPLGMKKKKKLSRFFIDQKIHKIDKEKQLVVEADKKIIWLVGHRIDDRFKLNQNTKRVLNLKWKHD